VVINVVGASINPLAIDVSLPTALRLFLSHGPWVYWTTLVSPPGAKAASDGLLSAVTTPSPAIAVVSTVILAAAAVGAWCLLAQPLRRPVGDRARAAPLPVRSGAPRPR
jgi:hypothetical protein